MEGEEEIDRISKLPDSLIHEILSFIDMKYVVQTCVLSKRWKNIWMSLPFISLDCSSFLDDRKYNLNDSAIRFIGFLDKVFELRDGSDDIQMIKLILHIFNDALVEALNRWILAAVNQNVQVLTIKVGYYLNSAYVIPGQLLHCKSLKSLSIVFVRPPTIGLYTDIILPNSISFPQIKTLWLRGIAISNLELQMLFSACPLVETVSIQDCDIRMNNQKNIIIDTHSLQKFALVSNRHSHLGSADHSLTYTTKISSQNLKRLICIGFMTEDFSLENLSSLLGAQLKMRVREEETDETAETYSLLPVEEKAVFAKRMMKFLRAVHNVERLALSSGFLEVLLQAPGTLSRQPPQLSNLEILNLEMRFTSGCLCSIAYLLKISPIVTTIKLKSMESNLADVGDDWEAGCSMTCMFTHLKIFELREAEGCDNELKFMRFLLKKSIVLEQVNLFFRSASDSLDRVEQVTVFKRNLRALPTASSNIKLEFF